MAKNTEQKTRMAPHNLEAEQAVLGSILLSGDVAIEAFGGLQERDFYSEIHQMVFGAMRSVYERNQPVDFVTLTDELDKRDQLQTIGGTAYLTTLSNVVPSAASFSIYKQIVKKNSVLRDLISASEKIIQKAYSSDDQDALSFAEGQIFGLAEKGHASELVLIENSLDDVLAKFETIQKDITSLQGLPTGFFALDDITNGLQKSDLIFVAARPGVGKTSLTMNFASHAALERGAKVAVFSLEMPAVQLSQRMLCSVAGVSMAKALKGEMSAQEWTKLYNALKKLKKAQIFIDDSSLNTPSQILSKCRKLKREKGLDLIIIDYLQLMSGDSGKTENRQQEISEISRKLKILAKELNVPVVVLSQLSRAVESRQGHRPVLSDLRESGSIEQDADMVLFIHKKEMYDQAEGKEIDNDNMSVELIIAKHRNGKLGSVFLTWRGSTLSFVSQQRDADVASAMASAPPAPLNPEPIPEEVEQEIRNIFGDDD